MASALRLLVDAGARIRGVKRLHAKLYLLGHQHVIVTSANLTERGLLANHEFGLVADEPALVGSAVRYFRRLWRRAGSDLSTDRIDAWENLLAGVRLRGAAPSVVDSLPDDGTEAGLPDNSTPTTLGAA